MIEKTFTDKLTKKSFESAYKEAHLGDKKVKVDSIQTSPALIFRVVEEICDFSLEKEAKKLGVSLEEYKQMILDNRERSLTLYSDTEVKCTNLSVVEENEIRFISKKAVVKLMVEEE